MYGCRGRRKISSAGPASTIVPAYITTTRSASRADDGEVVRDVQHGEAELAAQVAELLDDARLRDDVEARRRLVEHDERRLPDERDRDREPLLLATRELVRVAAQEAAVGRQVHALEHAPGRVAARLGRGLRAQHLADLVARRAARD